MGILVAGFASMLKIILTRCASCLASGVTLIT